MILSIAFLKICQKTSVSVFGFPLEYKVEKSDRFGKMFRTPNIGPAITI